MREILFRGKAISRNKGYHRTKYKNGDWVYGLLTRLYDEQFENLPAEMTNTDGVSGIEIDHKTVGQYTGLAAYWYDFENEPQEEDVWEHDLLEVIYEGKKVIAKVEFEAGMFILCSNEFADSYIPLFKVVASDGDNYILAKKIGNIHDNPELLKEGTE